MCGIIGYTGLREAPPVLLEGLRRLEYRGYDSAGIAVITASGAAKIARSEGKLSNLRDRLEKEPVSGNCGIGHTRWATHGRPTEQNAHPHRQGKVSVIHNGIIENHLDLRAQLEAQGCRFASETDTEIFAHLIDREIAQRGGSDFRAAVARALEKARGTWAICVLHDDHPQEIVAARQNAPLLLGLGDDGSHENFVASDVAAILEHTRRVIDLEDGDTAFVSRDRWAVFDANGREVKRPERRVDWNPVAAEREGFRHFMLKEIHEQPRVISDALAGRVSLEQADVKLDSLDLDVDQVKRLVLLGCGTSWHAAMCGKYIVQRLARLPIEVDLASEFRYREPVIEPGTLAIAVSQSGETADTMAAIREAKRLGCRTLAVCNVVGSSIARTTDQVVYTHAGPEVSVASTKAFTSQLTIFVLLALHFAKRRGTIADDEIRRLLTGLSAVPGAMAQAVGLSAAVRTIAKRYVHAKDFLYLGRGLGFPVALEGALKLKEVSYVHAEGYASGEMKHGPIALIDEGLPVVVIAQKGAGYEKVLSNLAEVRARGGKIIALATMGDREIGDVADDVVLVPEVDELLQPLVAAVPLQLLAYHIADLRGTDVDQPRNLAKSVTVE
ncbi:MAG TPA: glutamine--fructose-6-phosphate transaminase (isomerizing) [Nannocystaceae bacterium]|nr:glutamine--fructose-6-phosphate transaminase (isomerizing) [Nannocystaceae bacterium]